MAGNPAPRFPSLRGPPFSICELKDGQRQRRTRLEGRPCRLGLPHRWEIPARCAGTQLWGPHCQDKAREGSELSSVSFHRELLNSPSYAYL